MARPRLSAPKLDFPDRHEETVQPWLWVKLALLALAVAYLIAFAIKNNDKDEIDFVLWTSSVSRIWLILISVLVGLIGGLLLSQLYRARQKRRSGPASARPPGAPPPIT